MQPNRRWSENVDERVTDTQTRIISAEVTPEQEVRRGHLFLVIYVLSIVLTSLIFVALATIAYSGDVPRFDVGIARAIQGVHLPLYGAVLTHVSDLGFPPLSVISYIAVFAVFFALNLRLEAIVALGSSFLADVVGSVIRSFVERSRPSGTIIHVASHIGGFSFPSGHVIQYTTLFGFSFYLVLVVWRSNLLRNLVLLVLLLLVLLVGPSRVYLGQHWPSDVLGAYLFSAVWLAGTIELFMFLEKRMRRGRGASWVRWWLGDRRDMRGGVDGVGRR